MFGELENARNNFILLELDFNLMEKEVLLSN